MQVQQKEQQNKEDKIIQSPHNHRHERINTKEQARTENTKQPINNQQTNRSHTQQNDLDETDHLIFKDYFDHLLSNTPKYQEAFVQIVPKIIQTQISRGHIILPEERGSIDEIILQSRIKYERGNKYNEEEEKRMALQMQLKYLDQQITKGKRKLKQMESQQQNELSGVQFGTVLSKKQHSQFLQKIMKQRHQLSLRKQEMQERQKRKQQQKEILQKISEQQILQKEKQEKKKRIIQRLEQQKKNNEQKAKQEEQAKKRLSQLKNKKLLHEKLQEKFATQVLIPSLEEKKRRLKEIREMSKAFNVDDINNHEKEYIKKREEVLSTSQTKRKNEEWHYKIPEKSHKLAKLLEEQNLQAKLKLQQKKRKLEEKIHRQEEFAIYLRERYKPSIDPKKREQIQERLRLKSEEKDKDKDKPDHKALGMNYLEQAKNLRKKSAYSQLQFDRKQNLGQKIQQQNKKSQTNYLHPRKTKQQYQQLRQKRIDRLINSSNTEKSEKIMKLQIEAEKLFEEQKRLEQKNKATKKKTTKEEEIDGSTNLLLASIKAKMGIIDLYNN